MTNYDHGNKFPEWAINLAPEVVQLYIDLKCAAKKGDEVAPILYYGRWEYPVMDNPFTLYAELTNARNKEWESIFLKLLTDDRAKYIWESAQKINLHPQQFWGMVCLSFTNHPHDKTSLMTDAEKRKYLEDTRDLATELAARLAGTRYEDATTKNLQRAIYSGARKASKIHNIEKEVLKKWFGWLSTIIKPLPFELSKVAKIINQDLDNEAYKHSAPNTINIGGKEYKVLAPIVDQKHKDREGQRTHFYKGLAHHLNNDTGNPRPTLVAQTTSIVFSDLSDLAPNYISKNWNK